MYVDCTDITAGSANNDFLTGAGASYFGHPHPETSPFYGIASSGKTLNF